MLKVANWNIHNQSIGSMLYKVDNLQSLNWVYRAQSVLSIGFPL